MSLKTKNKIVSASRLLCSNRSKCAHKRRSRYRRSVRASSFYTHMYGATQGTMEVFVNGTSVWSLSGDQGNAWMYQQVSLAAFAGLSNVVIEFHGTTSTSFSSDMAFDEVAIFDGCAVSGCMDPAACNYDNTATVDLSLIHI